MKVSIRIAENSTPGLTLGIPEIDEASYLKKLEELFAAQLASLGYIPEMAEDVELSLSVLSQSDMQNVNKEYRDIDSATDVLSFPLWEESGVFAPPADWGSLPLGDVLVCPEVVSRDAEEEKKTYIEELTLVICHGMLHLVGFDHDSVEREKEMWELQSHMVESFLEERHLMTKKGLDAEKAAELIAEAKAARLMAYAPYSRFLVGAAILCENGEIVTGCNVENASYGMAICAERNAMTTAVMRGSKKPLAIAVAGEQGKICPPCGACRQFLVEFNPKMTVVLEDKAGITTYILEDLLPAFFAFEEGDTQ